MTITGKLIPKVLDLFERSFCLDETLSICTEIIKDPVALQELKDLSVAAIEDGVSIACVETSTGKVVACMLNKIQVKYFFNYRILMVSTRDTRFQTIKYMTGF